MGKEEASKMIPEWHSPNPKADKNIEKRIAEIGNKYHVQLRFLPIADFEKDVDGWRTQYASENYAAALDIWRQHRGVPVEGDYENF